MSDDHDRITKVEVEVGTLKVEVENLRVAKHEHSNAIHGHNEILKGFYGVIEKIDTTLTKLITQTDTNKTAWTTLKVMIGTAIAMGTAFCGFIVFIAGKGQGWW